jgi:hypothetical protein
MVGGGDPAFAPDRRTSRLHGRAIPPWERNLELGFSAYFALKGNTSRAKNLVQAFEIIRLIEASPEERAKQLQKSPRARKLLAKVQAWNKANRWAGFYLVALQYLYNANGGVEPSEADVRKLAIRIGAYQDLVSTEKYQWKEFNGFMFSPAPQDSRFEKELQREITRLSDHHQPVWARLTRRYRPGIKRKNPVCQSTAK